MGSAEEFVKIKKMQKVKCATNKLIKRLLPKSKAGKEHLPPKDERIGRETNEIDTVDKEMVQKHSDSKKGDAPKATPKEISVTLDKTRKMLMEKKLVSEEKISVESETKNNVFDTSIDEKISEAFVEPIFDPVKLKSDSQCSDDSGFEEPTFAEKEQKRRNNELKETELTKGMHKLNIAETVRIFNEHTPIPNIDGKILNLTDTEKIFKNDIEETLRNLTIAGREDWEENAEVDGLNAEKAKEKKKRHLKEMLVPRGPIRFREDKTAVGPYQRMFNHVNSGIYSGGAVFVQEVPAALEDPAVPEGPSAVQPADEIDLEVFMKEFVAANPLDDQSITELLMQTQHEPSADTFSDLLLKHGEPEVVKHLNGANFLGTVDELCPKTAQNLLPDLAPESSLRNNLSPQLNTMEYNISPTGSSEYSSPLFDASEYDVSPGIATEVYNITPSSEEYDYNISPQLEPSYTISPQPVDLNYEKHTNCSMVQNIFDDPNFNADLTDEFPLNPLNQSNWSTNKSEIACPNWSTNKSEFAPEFLTHSISPPFIKVNNYDEQKGEKSIVQDIFDVPHLNAQLAEEFLRNPLNVPDRSSDKSKFATPNQSTTKSEELLIHSKSPPSVDVNNYNSDNSIVEDFFDDPSFTAQLAEEFLHNPLNNPYRSSNMSELASPNRSEFASPNRSEFASPNRSANKSEFPFASRSASGSELASQLLTPPRSNESRSTSSPYLYAEPYAQRSPPSDDGEERTYACTTSPARGRSTPTIRLEDAEPELKRKSSLNMSTFKKHMQTLSSQYAALPCCRKAPPHPVDAMKAHLANLPREKQNRMFLRVSKLSLEEVFDVLYFRVLRAPEAAPDDEAAGLLLLACQHLLAVRPHVFLTEEFGLALLSRAATGCPARPELTRYLVWCVRRALAARPAPAAAAAAPLFTHTDSGGDTLVGALARLGDAHADCLAALLARDAADAPLFDVEQRNKEGYSALHVACWVHNAEAGPRAARVAHVLLAHADMPLTLPDNKAGDTALHTAVGAPGCDLDMVLTLFLRVPASERKKLVYYKNAATKTPIEMARIESRKRPNFPEEVFQFLRKCR